MSNLKEDQPIKCKNCPLYTGIQCHGHGDFWGNCKALDVAYQILKATYKGKAYINYKNDYINYLFDESNCIFFTKDEINEH